MVLARKKSTNWIEKGISIIELRNLKKGNNFIFLDMLNKVTLIVNDFMNYK